MNPDDIKQAREALKIGIHYAKLKLAYNQAHDIETSFVVRDLKVMEIALTAAEEQGSIPDGWVLVPREPTRKMYDAGAGAMHAEKDRLKILWGNATDQYADTLSILAYRAMLSAAPKPPEQVNIADLRAKIEGMRKELTLRSSHKDVVHCDAHNAALDDVLALIPEGV